MKNLLITGGSGFIGRNLQEGLQGKYQIFAPTKEELDLVDYPAVEKYVVDNKIDLVIHGAIHVPMFDGEEKVFFNDMKMFANIEKISHKVSKVLYFGSGAEYDKRFDIEQVTEDEIGKHIPDSEYGLAKYTMNMIARNSSNIYNLRLFGIFGKYELYYYKFLSNICCKTIFDIPLTVRQDCYFDYLYIDDLVKVVEWFLTNDPKYHDYNVCTGEQYWLTEYAKKIEKIAGKELPLTVLNPQQRNNHYSGNNQRLISQIGSGYIQQIDNNLKKLYNYYIENKDIIDVEKIKNSK